MLLLAMNFSVLQTSKGSPTLEWGTQFGSSGADYAAGVAADSLGNIYTTGSTGGYLAGPNAGITDAFISKHNPSGELQWIRQFGTLGYEGGHSISTDPSGNVYIAGSTSGVLEGSSRGGLDAFVRKYDAYGSVLWTQQFGTSAEDTLLGVSTDGFGNIFVTGHVRSGPRQSVPGNADIFVSKLDASGSVQWFQQIGTNGVDWAFSVAADGLGNAYITGETLGTLGTVSQGLGDAFVSKFDSAGNLQWTQQFGSTSGDSGNRVATDGRGNVYVTGATSGSLEGTSAGGVDVFLRKYDGTGSHRWTRQLGTSRYDQSNGITADGLGNVYVTGETFGLLGDSSAGQNDAFAVKYDESGTLLWKHQVGTIYNDLGSDITADGFGHIYLLGYTLGSLAGPTKGNYDAFLLKFHDPSTVVPEPASIAMLATGIVYFATRRRCRRTFPRLSQGLAATGPNTGEGHAMSTKTA
jgi:hypothetical protein